MGDVVLGEGSGWIEQGFELAEFGVGLGNQGRRGKREQAAAGELGHGATRIRPVRIAR
jgi:hypothetical protein